MNKANENLLHFPHVHNMPAQLPQARSTVDAYTAPVSTYSYLQECGVHRVLHEVVLHNPHKVHQGHLLVWVHIVLPDLGLHNRHKDLLVDLLPLRMKLRVDAHRDHCLPRTEHLVVGCLLLDSPPEIDKGKRFLQHFIYLTVTAPCRFRF